MNADRKKSSLFNLVDGLAPVDAGDLADYEREMTDDAILKIVRDVEKRRMLAAKSRERRLELPYESKPGLST